MLETYVYYSSSLVVHFIKIVWKHFEKINDKMCYYIIIKLFNHAIIETIAEKKDAPTY